MKNDLLKQYVSLRDSLTKEKAALEVRLAEINRALGGDSGAANTAAAAAPRAKAGAAAKEETRATKAAGRPRKRAQNNKSLRDTVVDSLANKPLNRQEILEAVLKSGYVFSAKDPLNSLSTLLYTDKKTFKNKDGKFSVS